MQYIIILIFIITVVAKAAKKTTGGEASGSQSQNAARTAPAGRPQPAASTRTHVAPPRAPQDNERIRRLNIANYSRCSDFSFKDVAPGEDELEALIRHNHAHEEELAQYMETAH